MGAKLTNDDSRYCMYCDALRDRIPCEVCGNPTHSMRPVNDAYLAACPAVSDHQGDA